MFFGPEYVKDNLLFIHVPLFMIISFVQYHVLFSSIQTWINLLRDKKRKKKSRDLWGSLVLFILLNPLILAILFVVMLSLSSNIYVSFMTPCGVNIREISPLTPAEHAGLSTNEKIVELNKNNITTPKDVIALMDKTIPGQTINLKTNKSEYNIILTKNENSTSGYLGVFISPAFCKK